MKLFVNARFLTQPVSGVQRYGIECSLQIKKKLPDTVFLAPKNILHKELANELNATAIGINTGHAWEQLDLPVYMWRTRHAPLLNLANTAPLLYTNNFITIHDLAFYHHPEWNSKAFAAWYNILIPRLAAGSRHIFTVSNTIRCELMSCYHLPASKISVTGNGIAGKMLNNPISKDNVKEKIILSVGSFSLRKNHMNLVRAFMGSQLKGQYKLVVIGDRSRVFRESGLDEKDISDNNIKICDHMDSDELIGMYKKADIVVSLSLYEGFGIPLLEGLYYGCKIVCSDIPVYREVYDGYASFCNPHDLQSINEALCGAVNSERADIRPLLEKYSYTRAADKIIAQISGKK